MVLLDLYNKTQIQEMLHLPTHKYKFISSQFIIRNSAVLTQKLHLNNEVIHVHINAIFPFINHEKLLIYRCEFPIIQIVR